MKQTIRLMAETIFLLIISVILLFFKEKVSTLMCNILVMGVIFVIFGYGIELFLFVRQGINNISNCGDVVFDEMDEIVDVFRKRNDYSQQIVTIYNYYNNRISDEINDNNKLGRLYKRKCFVIRKRDFASNIVNDCGAFLISYLVSWIVLLIARVNVLNFIGILSTVVLFFGILLLKYSDGITRFSEQNMIYEYELNILEDSIKKLEKEIVEVRSGEECKSTGSINKM